MNVIIDASNIRTGGGVSHLVELMRVAQPRVHGFAKVVIFSGLTTLSRIEDRDWLVKKHVPLLDRSLLWRTFWQFRYLRKAAQSEGCDLLFIPGGILGTKFRPVVTMNQNLLPFDWSELRRYGCSLTIIRLILLRWVQTYSFRHTDGVIFLTDYAKNTTLDVIGKMQGQTRCIPHGVNSRFLMKPKHQRAITEYSIQNPYRLIYVSIIDVYKHQWNVIEAVSIIRNEGVPLVLDLVGPAYLPALEHLNESLDIFDPNRNWVHYHGIVPYAELGNKYSMADLAIFASSCETFGLILLEKMAAGLPIISSNCAPLPGILQDASVYFDPINPSSIASALRKMVESPELRKEKATTSYRLAQQYTWERCANDTFRFLSEVAANNQESICAEL